MKKIIAFLISTVMIVTMFSSTIFTVNAEENNPLADGIIVSETTEYLSDGTSITTIVMDTTNITTYGTTYTKTGSAAKIARNDKGQELWRITVNGTFSVNAGVSATCTKVSHSYTITDTAWQNESISSSKSANIASATGKFIRKVLFVTVETREATATLTCDKNGNLS